MIPSPCPGLIPCTPIPTQRPTGLTHDEAVALGNLAGTAFGLTTLAILIIVAVALSIAVVIAIRGD